MQNIAVLSVAITLVSSVVAAQTTDKRAISQDLPRNYVGDFRWQGDVVSQSVEFRFNIVRALDEHSAEALGCGRYNTLGEITEIKARMLITQPDLSVELFELDPIGSASFVIDGSHVGSLSQDLQEIVAEWTTLATGNKGHLRLHAGGALQCSPAVAGEGKRKGQQFMIGKYS
jgi:hypothetical protein